MATNPIFHSQYTAAQIEGAIGHGPRINASGYWEVWNIGTMAYESTGVGAGVQPPTVVTQASQMTNHGYIYIYNGSEAGFTAGYWYYWNGTSWTAGGAYQVAATDPTLSVSGGIADAKIVGNAFNAGYAQLEWSPGLTLGKYIKFADGTEGSSDKYCRTTLWNGYHYRIAVEIADPTYTCSVAYFASGGSVTTGAGFLGHDAYTTGMHYIPMTAILFGLSFRRADQATMTSDDVTAISAALKAYGITDSTLSQKGIAADAKTVGDKFNAASSAMERMNWYDPTASYSIVGSNGTTAASGVTKNADGSITYTKSYGEAGQVQLRDKDTTKVLTPGKYNMSARVTLNDGVTNSSRDINVRLGLQNTYSTVTMKTVRGGSENTTGKVGWISKVFTISSDDVFIFQIQPKVANICSSSLPVIIDNIQITKTSELLDYTADLYTANDVFARQTADNADAVANATAKMLSVPIDTPVEAEDNGINYGNGNLSSNSYYNASAYVKISGFGSISFKRIQVTASTHVCGIAFYNASKTYISGVAPLTGQDTRGYAAELYTTPVPENAVYVRFSMYKDVDTYGAFKAEGTYDAVYRIATLEETRPKTSAIFNGEPYSGTYEWQTPVVNYCKLFKGVENVEAFAFFTDPHVMGFADSSRNTTKMREYVKKASKVLRAIPFQSICGGDWLNNSTTMDEACYRLGYIKGLAKNMLCDCKLLIGNHDTNYQGKLNATSENGTGTLPNATIAALMVGDTDTRKAYYSWDGIRSKCYALDTGIEHSDMTAYDWEQVAWLAGKLAEDDPAHAIIFMHIIINNGNVQTNASNFGTLVSAYNSHSTVTLNGTTYDFSGCTGHVDLWVAGHIHSDSNGTLGGVPYVLTKTLGYNSDVPIIDLFLVDYDNDVVKIVRAGGSGSDRTISLA